MRPIDWLVDDRLRSTGGWTRSPHEDDVLTPTGVFQEVTAPRRGNTGAGAEACRFARGAVIFAEGDPATACTSSAPGKVKLGRKTPDGRENLLAVAGPADMFGELSIFDPVPGRRPRRRSPRCPPHRWTAALREWIGKRPEIAEQLLRVLAAGCAGRTTCSPI